MKIEHNKNGNNGSFFINEGEHKVAEMTYTLRSADKMIIDHTEVDDKLRGKHAGNDMVNEAVQYARTNHIKIIPLCPFVKSVFDKSPDIRDVLD